MTNVQDEMEIARLESQAQLQWGLSVSVVLYLAPLAVEFIKAHMP